jgi:hypothetical protein
MRTFRSSHISIQWSLMSALRPRKKARSSSMKDQKPICCSIIYIHQGGALCHPCYRGWSDVFHLIKLSHSLYDHIHASEDIDIAIHHWEFCIAFPGIVEHICLRQIHAKRNFVTSFITSIILQKIQLCQGLWGSEVLGMNERNASFKGFWTQRN